jgi:hypothetical protein
MGSTWDCHTPFQSLTVPSQGHYTGYQVLRASRGTTPLRTDTQERAGGSVDSHLWEPEANGPAAIGEVAA